MTDYISREDALAAVRAERFANTPTTQTAAHNVALDKAEAAIRALPSVSVAGVGVTREEIVSTISSAFDIFMDQGNDEATEAVEAAADAILALLKPVATVQMGESELRHRLEWLAFKANSPTREDLQIEVEHILSRLKPVVVDVEAVARECAATTRDLVIPWDELSPIDRTAFVSQAYRILRAAKVIE